MFRFDVKIGEKLEGWRVGKLDIRTREYNLNYQFKYLKSVAESGIVVMVST